MKPTIWKYELEVADQQTIEMPAHAVPVCVQVQFGKPCLWALVDSDQPPRPRTFVVAGTGHALPDDKHLSYLGSFQLAGGQFVGHVFEFLLSPPEILQSLREFVSDKKAVFEEFTS